jgi:DNA mismatch repair protein MutS2
MSFANNEVLEYRALKEILVKFADSPVGAQLIEQSVPFTQKVEIQKQFDLVRECLELVQANEGLRFHDLIDFSQLFEKLGIEGNALNSEEILEIIKLALCAQGVKKSLQSLAKDLPNLAEIERLLPELARLISLLAGKINPSGEVEDDASPLLKKIRNEIGIIRNRLHNSLGQILRRHTEAQVIQDDVITIRNDRFVIPVRIEKRKELAGVVHGTSSSGSTIFIEPLETIELNNQLVRLRGQAEEEIQAILATLTAKIRESFIDLKNAVRLLGYLDSIFAKARFSQKYHCIIPLINEEGVLAVAEGRHPILEGTLEAQGTAIVPISIELDNSKYILVISGPNTGGKTVALKTLGLLTLMALSGIPVPAASANICVFDQVFADIGDHQSISENLSTFSSHLINIKSILEEVSRPALVLLDELGTGTDPAEGSALAVAITESLRERGIMTVATTHHNGLKIYASKTPRVANASVEFDEFTLRPTFRLIHGIPGNSSGIEIAKRLGLPDSLISHAQRLISKEEQEVAQYSRFLRDQIEKTTKAREQLETDRRELENHRTYLEEKYRALGMRKSKEIEQYWQRAFERFENDTRQLISEIQDKFLAVRARREIDRRAAKFREQAHQELLSLSEPETPEDQPPKSPSSNLPITPGSKVIVKRFGREGTVVAPLKGGQWEVAVGNLKCIVSPSDVESTGTTADSEEKQIRRPVHINVQLNSPELQSNEINLVGYTVDEAISKADKFLDKAYLASISPVRIVHGSGMGILRRAISEWLLAQPHVDSFHAAHANEGGNGVTVVSLRV